MNELESLSQLNKMLLAESPQYLAQAAAFPPDAEAQWRLLRSLVNVRAPRPAGGDFLALPGQLAAKNNRLQGSHRLSFADADAERPVPGGGAISPPCRLMGS